MSLPPSEGMFNAGKETLGTLTIPAVEDIDEECLFVSPQVMAEEAEVEAEEEDLKAHSSQVPLISHY